MNYIGIATKDYGMGRICVSADRISGYRSGHGASSTVFWRKMLEWIGQRKPFETVKVAAIVSIESNFESRLFDLSPINVETVDLSYLAKRDLSQFDLLYFIGTPETIDDEVKTTIKNYIEIGGGLLVETPSSGTINVIDSIDTITVDSMQRPSYGKAYWTQNGITHQCYVPDAKISMLVSMGISQFDESWEILLSDIETKYDTQTRILDLNFNASNSLISQFGVAAGTYMKNGIVLLEEGDDEYESTSSSSESIGNVSESSSSSSNIVDWNICDNIVAQWKMNDQRQNPIITDSSNNLFNMGLIYRGETTITSASVSSDGGISFNGESDFIITASSNHLRFNNGVTNDDFGFSGWFYSQNNDGIIISKRGVWEIGLSNSNVYFVRYDDYGKITKITTTTTVEKNKWNHLIVNADKTTPLIFVNAVQMSVITFDNGYSGVNTVESETCIGWNGNNQRIYVEANGLWGRGGANGNSDPNGESGLSFSTEACYISEYLESNLLPSKSFRPSSLLCFFEDSNGNPIYVNGVIIYFVGKNFEVTLPLSARNVVFGFHDQSRWEDNTGNASVNVSWENGIEQTLTVPATASLYFRWADNACTVKASETINDFAGSWTDYSNQLRPISLSIPQSLPFKGVLDNLIVTDRLLTSLEIEALYNYGERTEKCFGAYQYNSSSSSSSSSIDSSSSSSSIGTSSSSSIGTSSSSSSHGYSTSSSFSSTSLSSVIYSSSTSSMSESSHSSGSTDSSSTSSSSTEDWFTEVKPASAWASNYTLMHDKAHDGVIPTNIYPIWVDAANNTLMANVGFTSPGIGYAGWPAPFIWTMDFGPGVYYVINNYALHAFGIGYGTGPYYPPDMGSAPTRWTFEGSNDNETWTVLDTRSDISWDRTYKMFRNIGNSNPYRLYRFYFTAKGGSLYFGLAEIRLG